MVGRILNNLMNNQYYLDERNKRLLEIINPSKGDKILIVGTGTSPMIELFLVNLGCKNIVSIDVVESNLINAREKIPEVKFLYADANKKLPFRDDEFDKIILTEVLYYLDDENFSLKEINRILKKKGNLILSLPKKSLFNYIHPVISIQGYKQYSSAEIENTLNKTGFNITKSFYGRGISNILNLYFHCFFKYILRIHHPDAFSIFKKSMDKSWKESKESRLNMIIEAIK
jgi:ubiquinone/menaquinone biosynthesis C-methylase UbiE